MNSLISCFKLSIKPRNGTSLVRDWVIVIYEKLKIRGWRQIKKLVQNCTKSFTDLFRVNLTWVPNNTVFFQTQWRQISLQSMVTWCYWWQSKDLTQIARHIQHCTISFFLDQDSSIGLEKMLHYIHQCRHRIVGS